MVNLFFQTVSVGLLLIKMVTMVEFGRCMIKKVMLAVGKVRELVHLMKN